MLEKNSLTKKEYWEDIYAGKKRPTSTKGAGCIDHILKKNLVYHQLNHLFKKHLPQEPKLKFIEYGCGASFWLPYFNIKFGYDVEGIDYSQLGCDLAEKQLQRFSATGCVYQKNFIELNENFNNKYDICASFGVIEHFENPCGIIAKFFKTIKENGIMITVVPNLTGIQGFLQRWLGREIYDMHRILSLAKVKQLHEDNGLDIIYAGHIGIPTLGLNIGQQRKILTRIYKIYAAILNRVSCFTYKIVPRLPWELPGASFVVIAMKKQGAL